MSKQNIPQSIRNTNTLASICKEISEKYIGWSVAEIIRYSTDAVDITLDNGNTEVSIRIDISNKYSSIYILTQKPKYRQKHPIFSALSEEHIKNSKTLRNDRIVKFDFGKYALIIELFGRGASAIYLLNYSNKILESYGRTSDTDKYILSDLPEKPDVSNINPADYPYRWPKHYIIESEKSDKSIEEFHRYIYQSEEFYAYRDVNGLYVFSHIQLSESGLDLEFSSPSPSAVVERIVSRCRYLESYESLFQNLERLLKRRKKKLENKISAFSDSQRLIDKSDEYRLWADVLMARPDIKEKFDHLDTKDWNGNSITIPLDEKISLLENAQKYYEKIKTLEKTIQEQQAMLPELESDLLELLEIEEKLSDKPRFKDLEKLQKQYKWLQGQSFDSGKKEDKFRKFELTDHVTLYVGKSAANNDELTNHFAKPNDIWLHAKDVSGSHAVIKGVSIDNIQKSILEKAGEIIAYYSSARNQSYAPVSYTQKKYVRKPKGAAPGAVIVTREDVIFVEPGLPK